jgi:hypothetical protein
MLVLAHNQEQEYATSIISRNLEHRHKCSANGLQVNFFEMQESVGTPLCADALCKHA